MAEEYDLVILGGGTGGYVAAIRAAQYGLKVAVVEKEKLGGTCLHKGCIPSKALLRSAEVFETTKRAAQFGVKTGQVELDFEQVQNRKETIVDQLYRGVQQLMKKGKIDVFYGRGRILGPSIFSPSPGTISVERTDGEENSMLIPKYVIIATGSSPRTLEGLEVDGTYVLTSEEALKLTELPSSMLIVGGGVIGVEWASMFADFGVDVTILEFGPTVLPTEDRDIAKEAARLFKQKGIKIVTNANIRPDTIKTNESGLQIQVECDGAIQQFEAEKLLLSIGRVANVNDIGLSNTDIELDRGVISVNKYNQTKESHIYAIGDVIGGLQLAHVASHEGILAVDHLAGKNPVPIDYTTVPKCIYSAPEMASVGLTEAEAIEQGYQVKVAKFPFKAIGKALVFGETDGFVKVIVNAANQDLLGVHMLGPNVTDLISEAGLAKLLDAAHFEVAEMIHPHPTLSEILGEAALAIDGKAIHS